MSDHMYNELQLKVQLPQMTMDNYFLSKNDLSISRHLSTKQVIRIPAAEVKEILAEKEYDMPDFLVMFEDGLAESDVSKYADMSDGYQMSEYFSKADFYIPTFDYFRAVKFGGIDCIMNIYNGRQCKIPFKQVLSKIKIETPEEQEAHTDVYPFPMITKDTINYTKFKNVSYCDNLRTQTYMYRFPALCLNLPYKYYKSQNIPENIYFWDVDTKELGFAGHSTDEIFEWFEDICKHGLQKPLYFQISQGQIVSATDEDYIKLLIAQYLKIPTIPVVAYMLNNSAKSSMLISMRPCDIIGARTGSLNTDKETLTLINEICSPYFIFFNSNLTDSLSVNENVHEDMENKDGPVYNQIFDSTHNDLDYNESYLLQNDDSNIFDDNLGDPTPSYILHENMRNDIQKQINEDIERSLKQLELLSGQ